MVDIIRKIDNMRIDRGLTIYEFANKCDISQQTYHQWVDSDTMPSIPALQKVCNFLNVTLAELFSDNELVELTPELKKLYQNWQCLTKDEQLSVKQIVVNYINNKKK